MTPPIELKEKPMSNLKRKNSLHAAVLAFLTLGFAATNVSHAFAGDAVHHARLARDQQHNFGNYRYFNQASTVQPREGVHDAWHGHFADPWDDPRSNEGNGG